MQAFSGIILQVFKFPVVSSFVLFHCNFCKLQTSNHCAPICRLTAEAYYDYDICSEVCSGSRPFQ